MTDGCAPAVRAYRHEARSIARTSCARRATGARAGLSTDDVEGASAVERGMQ
jgi:hypothetical protein